LIHSFLKLYLLGDIRDYLILLGFLFDMDLEDIYSEGLHEQVAKNKLELEKKPSEEEVYDTFRVERYTFYYENKIMNLVSQGDIQLLKSGLTGAILPNRYLPDPYQTKTLKGSNNL